MELLLCHLLRIREARCLQMAHTCQNYRGKGLFVCLIVWFWFCTEVTVPINPCCSVAPSGHCHVCGARARPRDESGGG